MNRRLQMIYSFGKTVRSYLTWGDQILIVSLLLVILSMIFFWGGSTEMNGRWAIVRLDGQIVHQLSLAQDQEITVTGPAGETVIQVQGVRVRVLRSPGPQEICLRQGWIHKPGEALICLPNRITVEIPGNSGIDGITR